MSDGIKNWADEEDEKYYKENFEKDKIALEQLLESKEFKRLQELRNKFSELKELLNLENFIESKIRQHDTSYGSHREIKEKLIEGKIYI